MHRHGLAVPARAHVNAIVVRPVVFIATQDDLDEGRADREVHRALGGRVGARREVELRLAHFWLVSVRYGFPAESQCVLGEGRVPCKRRSRERGFQANICANR